MDVTARPSSFSPNVQLGIPDKCTLRFIFPSTELVKISPCSSIKTFTSSSTLTKISFLAYLMPWSLHLTDPNLSVLALRCNVRPLVDFLAARVSFNLNPSLTATLGTNAFKYAGSRFTGYPNCTTSSKT